MVVQIERLTFTWSFHRLKPGTLPSLTRGSQHLLTFCPAGRGRSLWVWAWTLTAQAALCRLNHVWPCVAPWHMLLPLISSREKNAWLVQHPWPSSTPYCRRGLDSGGQSLPLPTSPPHAPGCTDIKGCASAGQVHCIACLIKGQFAPHLLTLIISYIYMARNVWICSISWSVCPLPDQFVRCWLLLSKQHSSAYILLLCFRCLLSGLGVLPAPEVCLRSEHVVLRCAESEVMGRRREHRAWEQSPGAQGQAPHFAAWGRSAGRPPSCPTSSSSREPRHV